MTTSVSLDRTSLSLSPLVIGLYSPTASMFLPSDGVFRPDYSMRHSFAPSSDFMPQQILSSVADQGSWPLAVYLQGTSTAAVEALRAELRAACTQPVFSVTLTIDGQPEVFSVIGEFPQWGQLDTAMVAAFLQRASVSFQVLIS